MTHVSYLAYYYCIFNERREFRSRSEASLLQVITHTCFLHLIHKVWLSYVMDGIRDVQFVHFRYLLFAVAAILGD